ncbi:hypothetical protein CF336_g6888 [Tilletia laevis]|uniref:Uncharacterized protein n=1 Tax=Tilletia caries TaxID=13290 RepID=A0A177TQL8_9BASI|nr:hypothetical protein CF336_g6888 [Tilletia laevis]KAE8189062.1 hypothetical protein CF335_g6721 [Tilletia laevis]KAE8248702.1 hypothetical protein A4X03_0g6719 [Tilletia caries]
MTPSSRLTLSEFVSATCVLLDAMRSIANDATDPTSRRLLNIEADIWSTQFDLIFKHFLRRESEINWPVLVEYCQTMRHSSTSQSDATSPPPPPATEVIISAPSAARVPTTHKLAGGESSPLSADGYEKILKDLDLFHAYGDGRGSSYGL